MENKEYPKVLYHYASMEKAASILKYKNIRLSDITKSNDVNEMSIFFPGLFEEMLNNYDEYNGFGCKFVYKGKEDRAAFSLLVSEIKKRIEKEFEDGSISTFVLCLSEEGDLLSQWRGYANDGKGVCLGLSVEEIRKFVDIPAFTGFALEKVEYLSKGEINQWIKDSANGLLLLINTILKAIHSGELHFEWGSKFDEEIFDTLYYNILSDIEESIKFKSDGFKEEKEWRLFVKNSLNKEELKGKTYTTIGSMSREARRKASQYVDDNVDFNVKENDIVPFVSLAFDKFSNNLICELICGPNNTIRSRDMELYLRKNGYVGCEYSKSNITYIVR